MVIHLFSVSCFLFYLFSFVLFLSYFFVFLSAAHTLQVHQPRALLEDVRVGQARGGGGEDLLQHRRVVGAAVELREGDKEGRRPGGHRGRHAGAGKRLALPAAETGHAATIVWSAASSECEWRPERQREDECLHGLP